MAYLENCETCHCERSAAISSLKPRPLLQRDCHVAMLLAMTEVRDRSFTIFSAYWSGRRCSIVNDMATLPEITITPMTLDDWPAVRRIYAEGIATGNATFETETPTWDTWNRNHLPACGVEAAQDVQVVTRPDGSVGEIGHGRLPRISGKSKLFA